MTKKNLQSIMVQAWSFVKRNGYTMSEALKCAWANFKLKNAFTKGIVHFHFRKVDGTIREAFGTLKKSIVPQTNGNSRNNPTIQTYFDTEVGNWRCFKVANLISVEL